MPLPTHAASSSWRTLAIAALGGGALLALLLAIARTPVLSDLVTPAGFERTLVLHVTLISVVWLAAMSAHLWGGSQRSAGIAAVGVALMITAGLGGLGAPVLADYLPFLDHALFTSGAALFAAGVLASALRAPCSLATPWDVALTFMRLPMLLAIVEACGRLAARGDPADALWGAGHQAQIAWTVLLLGLWARAARRPGTGTLLIMTTALLSVVAPGLFLLGLADLDAMHSAVMRVGLGSALCVALVVLRPWRGAVADRCAAVLAAFGLAIGTLITAQTTTIPAHYHGTVGAVSLGLFALALPAAGRALIAHGIGLLTMMVGLLMTGLAGLARKQVLDLSAMDGLALPGSMLVGLGGLVAAFAALSALGTAGLATRPRKHRIELT